MYVLAVITFADIGSDGLTIVLFFLGIAGVTLTYEVGQRHLTFIGS